MISTILAEYARWAPLAFWVGIAILFAAAVTIASRQWRWPSRALSIVSVIAAASLTLIASPPTTSGIVCTVQISSPFQGIETLANIALLLPAALFLTLWTRRPIVVTLAGIAVSAAVETTQALIPALGRACDTNDLFMNSIGVIMGAGLGLAALTTGRRIRARRAAHHPTHSTADLNGPSGNLGPIRR